MKRARQQTIWWYIVRTDKCPYPYWGWGKWGSDSRKCSTKFDTRERAE